MNIQYLSNTFFTDNACPMDMFRCTNGTCIPMAWVCDGLYDCWDKSDENKHCNFGKTIDHYYVQAIIE